MNFFEILLVAVGLSMDSLAASLAVGASGFANQRRSILRLAFHLALFQACFPVLGWLLGRSIEPLIAAYDHWVAFFLLAAVAIRMATEGAGDPQLAARRNPTRGASMLMLSIGTSIDALAIGLGMAMLGIAIWTPSLVIGIITALVSIGGMLIGGRLNRQFGRVMQYCGALVLLLIGLRILLDHLGLFP